MAFVLVWKLLIIHVEALQWFCFVCTSRSALGPPTVLCSKFRG